MICLSIVGQSLNDSTDFVTRWKITNKKVCVIPMAGSHTEVRHHPNRQFCVKDFTYVNTTSVAPILQNGSLWNNFVLAEKKHTKILLIRVLGPAGAIQATYDPVNGAKLGQLVNIAAGIQVRIWHEGYFCVPPANTPDVEYFYSRVATDEDGDDSANYTTDLPDLSENASHFSTTPANIPLNAPPTITWAGQT